MALKFASPQDLSFKFISSKDDAVRCSNEDYAKYLESLDEQILDLNPEVQPTRFVLSLSSKVKDVLSAKDSMAGIAMKAQSTGEMPIYSLMFAQVRVAIKDILTGDVSEMKKGADGLVSDDIMLSLAASDILPEIFTALQGKQKTLGDVNLLKKS
ncbi:MAG: hypothetical protein EBR82_24915 [Caulobacteraceae bacterium]|jgi:hypothetical protein|nr:hypothetical protein [Caulobacteraceae bacterium]